MLGPGLVWVWGSGRGLSSPPSLSLRIVAARLNGSLDFFSLETHTSLNHLQFRGERCWNVSALPWAPAFPCSLFPPWHSPRPR